MIRRINKIVALVLAITSVCTVTPVSRLDGTANLNIFSVEAKADVKDSSEINLAPQSNNIALAISEEEEALNTVTEAMIPGKLNPIYSSVSADPTVNAVSKYTLCGHISYTLSDAATAKILSSFSSGMPTLISTMDVLALKGQDTINYGNLLIATGDPANVAKGQAYLQKGTKLKSSAEAVKTKLQQMAALSATDPNQLIAMIKAEATNIPVYQYTVSSLADGSTVAQGFSAGGTLGLALTPADTWNATKKSGAYSSIALVPSLPLSGSSQYKQTIDLTASGVKVICDGLNVNIMDYTNNKVYAINNPVYNMLQVTYVDEHGSHPADYKTSTTPDSLNIVSFSGVTKLNGFSSNIDLTSQGISTTILGISLTTSDSTPKNYTYSLPVNAYEKDMLDAYIDSMNLSTYGTTIKGMIKEGTYTMIPNVSSEVGNLIDKSGLGTTINGVTTGLNDLSDSMNDLTDALKDKNDDVDDAWDKVFDRFDNDEGWGERDGYRYYYDSDGVSKKGVQKINGKTYYFNRIDGAMETGWQIVDGKRCYFDKNKGYQMSNQWVEDNGEKYFVGEDGTVKKMAWVSVGGKNYYLKADGKMAKDWFKIDDSWYYFNEDGSMATSIWKMYKEKWHYLKENGQSAVGWLQLGENWYYFKDPSAELQTGWFRADGSWYYSNSDGTMKKGWAEASDGWCYLDDVTGKMKKNEWVTVDGNTYYFNVNGIMVTGSRYINGKKYVFNSDGTLNL